MWPFASNKSALIYFFWYCDQLSCCQHCSIMGRVRNIVESMLLAYSMQSVWRLHGSWHYQCGSWPYISVFQLTWQTLISAILYIYVQGCNNTTRLKMIKWYLVLANAASAASKVFLMINFHYQTKRVAQWIHYIFAGILWMHPCEIVYNAIQAANHQWRQR